MINDEKKPVEKSDTLPKDKWDIPEIPSTIEVCNEPEIELTKTNEEKE